MAKKFMYVCFGTLALAVAFHLGAQYGQAGYVDHSTSGVIGAELSYNGDSWLLLDNGEVWHWNEGNQEWVAHVSPPISVSQIKFWTERVVLDGADQVWVYSGGQWFNRGAPPGGATLTQPTTWSQIKAEFGE